jgi:hypothetical protein
LLNEIRERSREGELWRGAYSVDAWPAHLGHMHEATTPRERKTHLSFAYLRYTYLRTAQDVLGKSGSIRNDDEAVLYYRICHVLVDMVPHLDRVSTEVDSRRVLKNMAWLRTQAERSSVMLRQRNIVPPLRSWPTDPRDAVGATFPAEPDGRDRTRGGTTSHDTFDTHVRRQGTRPYRQPDEPTTSRAQSATTQPSQVVNGLDGCGATLVVGFCAVAIWAAVLVNGERRLWWLLVPLVAVLLVIRRVQRR